MFTPFGSEKRGLPKEECPVRPSSRASGSRSRSFRLRSGWPGSTNRVDSVDDVKMASRRPIISRVVRKEDLQPADHIYAKRSLGYEHHGIYIGANQVIHYYATKPLVAPPARCPECSLSTDTTDVRRTCLDCFLQNSKLMKTVYENPIHGNAEPPEETLRRAECLLNQGFGDYDLMYNNCEHFAIYCKTGCRPQVGCCLVGQVRRRIPCVIASAFMQFFHRPVTLVQDLPRV